MDLKAIRIHQTNTKINLKKNLYPRNIWPSVYILVIDLKSDYLLINKSAIPGPDLFYKDRL